MRLRVLWGVLALLAPAAADARDPVPDSPPAATSAEALYAEGRFAQAGEVAGRDARSADQQALAAKSYAAAAVLADDPARADALSDQALSHAEAAVALDPAHVEGRLQVAVALWLRDRSRGGFEAYLEGGPQRGRDLIEAVLADAPEEPWAHALLGAWHFEALRRGGDWAKRLLGADLAVGADAFHHAQALAPGDAAIAVQVGLSYLALDPERFADQAELALARALTIPQQDAFDAAMQARARSALGLIRSGDRAALDGAIASWFGG